ATDGSDAPRDCRSVLRLELRQLGKATITEDAVEGAAACPPGLVTVGGKCTRPRSDLAHECAPRDRSDCETQCAKGHLKSCSHLAMLYHYGRAGAPLDYARAASLYEKSCSAAIPDSCAGLGTMLA